MNLPEQLEYLVAFAKKRSAKGPSISEDRGVWWAQVGCVMKSTVYMDNSHMIQATGKTLSEAVTSLVEEIEKRNKQ